MGYYIPDDMWESLADQPKTVQNAVFGAVARLFFTGEEDKLTGVPKSVFIAFRDRVLKSRTNENNRKGKKKTEYETANETENETHNERGTNREGKVESAIKGGGGGREELPNGNSKTPIPPGAYEEIIGYLNAKTGKAFRDTSKATRGLIRARMAEGYAVADFKRVIDNKCAGWLHDPRMDGYLKPETLFSKAHFEGYLNERPATPKGGDDFADYAD